MVFNNQTFISNKNSKFANHSVLLRTLIVLLLVISGLLVSFALLRNASAASTVVVTENTSAGENQPGWLFNRDVTTSTPYEFNRDQNSGGEGSLYVLPIANTNTSGTAPTPNHDKFVAENFILSEIADVNDISYDFMIGPNAVASDANEFYMNVYANFGESSDTKYYDCRYNIVPSVGSTGAFTTVTFDPSQSYPVDKHGSSPYNCPSIPADMNTSSPGSTIRMFALNVGDTSASDQGVDGYLDNVVVNRVSDGVTVYDFEPEPLPPCSADDTTFDTFSLGSVNGQNGWSSTGAYDQAIEHNEYGHPSLGCKTLRISNAVTTGAFGDQTFSYSTANEAGEVDSTNNGQSGGIRENHFEAEFDVASTQLAQQPGLALSVSPDRGDGSRMSYLSFADSPGGIDVTFYDTPGTTNPANFNPTSVATLSRTAPHKVKFVIDYLDGPSNDVVKIYIDGALVHTGTSWENYYRFDSESAAEQSPRTTDSLIFRAAGAAVPANAGEGFLFDNVNLSTATTPDPVAPTLISPANNSFVNASSPIANDWSDVAGADHYVYQSYNVDGDGDCNLADIRFTGNYTDSQTNSRIIADGLTFCWRVKTVNVLGESAWSDTWKVTIDNSAPTAPSIVTPTAEQYIKITPILNDWTDSSDANAISKYQIEYVYDDGHTFSGAPYRETAGNVSQRNHTPATSEQGGVTIRVRAYDPAGNISDWSNSVHYFYDATAPSVPVHVSPSNGHVTTTANQTLVNWNDSTDASPVTYVYQSSLSSMVNPDGSFVAPAYTSGPLGSSEIPTPGTPAGTYYWHVKAVDMAGNQSAWSSSWVIVVDNTAPLAEITSPGDTDTVNGTVNLVGEVTDANPMNSYFRIEGPSGYLAESLFTDGRLIHEFNWDTSGLDDGTYTIYFETRDKAGNKAGTRAAPGDSVDVITVTVDNTAPVVTLDAIPDSDDTTPTLTGTVDDPDAVVTVAINGGTPASATNNGDGTWTYTVDPALTTGDYTVTVAATDSTGNATSPEPTDDFSVTEPVFAVTTTTGGDGGGGDGGGGGGAGAPAAFFAFFGVGGGAGDGGDGGDGGAGAGDQGVQGADDNANDGNGNVNAGENAKVAAATTDDSGWQFNWWWLAILAALAAAFYGWYRYRQAQADKTL